MFKLNCSLWRSERYTTLFFLLLNNLLLIIFFFLYFPIFCFRQTASFMTFQHLSIN